MEATRTAETISRHVALRYGIQPAWQGHIWNFYSPDRKGPKDNLMEYRVRGTRADNFRGEHDTGLTVRHEKDGTWTARVDGEVLEICRTKSDAQHAIEHGWLGI